MLFSTKRTFFVGPLYNPFPSHSGLDPKSRKYLKPLDSKSLQNDDISAFLKFHKGLYSCLHSIMDAKSMGIKKPTPPSKSSFMIFEGKVGFFIGITSGRFKPLYFYAAHLLIINQSCFISSMFFLSTRKHTQSTHAGDQQEQRGRFRHRVNVDIVDKNLTVIINEIKIY